MQGESVTSGAEQKKKGTIDAGRLGVLWKLRWLCFGAGVGMLRFASRFSKSVDPEQQNREILDRLDTILSWVPRGMRDRLTGNRDAAELFTLLEGREVDDVRGIGDAVETMQRREQVQASQKRVGRNAPCPCGSRKKFKHCCGHKA